MVKKIAAFLLYCIVFFVALVAFLPKENLYFESERFLEDAGVVIANETIEPTLFGMRIHDATILLRGIETAHIEKVSLRFFGIRQEFNFENVRLSSIASSFVPLHIDRVSLRHALWDPLHIYADVSGDLGKLRAAVNVVEKKVSVRLRPSKLMQSRYKESLRRLKKDANGEYVYEYAF